MRHLRGRLIGNAVITTGGYPGSASGIYNRNDHLGALKSGNWPALPVLPNAPTIGTATATGITTANVSYTAPVNNSGIPIISYTAVSSPGNITSTLTQSGSGTITVTGLSGATNYTFTVYATNAVGNGPSSGASNQITTMSPTPTIEYLVVAAGGSGGSTPGGPGAEPGAGGGGGVLNATVTTGFAFNTTYTVTVGAGVTNGNGGDSSISGTGFSVTATGGGRGTIAYNSGGQTGGSGGGSGRGYPSGGPGISGQGYAGASDQDCGGGGGAGRQAVKIGGGVGLYFANFTTNGEPAGWYGGGGNRNYDDTPNAISPVKGGGGGNWNGCTYGSPGTANTGGGGAAHHEGCNNFSAGGVIGGSGIVLIRYADSYKAATTTGSPTVTTSGGFRIYAFTGSGTINIPS